MRTECTENRASINPSRGPRTGRLLRRTPDRPTLRHEHACRPTTVPGDSPVRLWALSDLHISHPPEPGSPGRLSGASRRLADPGRRPDRRGAGARLAARRAHPQVPPAGLDAGQSRTLDRPRQGTGTPGRRALRTAPRRHCPVPRRADPRRSLSGCRTPGWEGPHRTAVPALRLQLPAAARSARRGRALGARNRSGLLRRIPASTPTRSRTGNRGAERGASRLPSGSPRARRTFPRC